MLRKKLLVNKKHQEKKNKFFVSKAAKVLLIVVLFLAVFLFVYPVLAQPDVGFEAIEEEIELGTQDIRVTIARIIRAFLGFLGIIAVVIIIYGGYLYMTSAGNPEKVTKAKKVLINATIGLIIILSSFAIASFILNYLVEATGGGRGVPGRPSYGAGGGALGNGIIESHYPERNAFDIPRNTSIVVTFKEPIDITSIIFDANDNGEYGDCFDADGNNQFDIADNNDDGQFNRADGDVSECDLINRDSIIIRRFDDTQGPFVELVKATVTADHQTFVFKPVELLGSSDQSIDYTVSLTENILKEDGSQAFGNFGNYSWNFEVSNRIDNTPPQIDSVLPAYSNNPNDTVPRNHIVQINFNEPINPMTMRGIAEVVSGATVGQLEADTFNNIMVSIPGDQYVAGEFLYSNGYQTVEFVTNDLCGKNTCGGDVFCLPGEEYINVLIKAASFSGFGGVTFPYDGIVDMADNSLDGNKDEQAQGPVDDPYNINFSNDPTYETDLYGDSAEWSFYTSNEIDLAPPEIESYSPESGEIGVDPTTDYEITFNKIIMSSTVKSGGEGYCSCLADDQCGNNSCDFTNNYCIDDEGQQYVCSTPCPDGQSCNIEKEYFMLIPPELMPPQYPAGGWAYWLRNSNYGGKTTAKIKHEDLGENINFDIRVGSGIKDITQNCYQPCAGPECSKVEIQPGEYEVQPGEWSPNDESFPTCDLTNVQYSATGNFILNYIDANGDPQTINFSAYSLAKSIEDFYLYRDDGAGGVGPRTFLDGFGGVFNTFMKPNRAMSFIYHDSLNNLYYLVNVHGAPLVGGGSFQGSITNAADEFYFAIRDDIGGDHDCNDVPITFGERYADCGNALYNHQGWIGPWADGEAIYIGDGSQDINFNINVESFVPTGVTEDPEWVFFMTQRSINVANSFPSSVSISYFANQ
ncbi:MAG: hypothetical protein GF365_00110 [Candidatus Buchananbacteria bacterium]|nr:hypothetical protein [Candidatus Buchananbacteria bacterium]